jgi:hypothetical protein
VGKKTKLSISETSALVMASAALCLRGDDATSRTSTIVQSLFQKKTPLSHRFSGFWASKRVRRAVSGPPQQRRCKINTPCMVILRLTKLASIGIC